MLGRIRLIHVVETPQVNSANVQTGNVEDCVLKRLNLDAQAHLRAVSRLVIFREAHNDRVQRRDPDR